MTQRDKLIGQSFRLAAIAASLVGASPLTAQAKPSAAIPATAPTQSVSDLPSAHPAATGSSPRGESHISWNGSSLTVDAAGDALPEILQQIARETGMKITGGVPDERVFGNYGPGSVQTVMGQLFDGLSINMMLINGSETSPKELVLTARTGSASPPQVRQVTNDDDRFRRRSNPVMPASLPTSRSFGPQGPRGATPSGPGGPPSDGDGSGGPGYPPPMPAGSASSDNSTPATGTTSDSTSTPAAGTDQQQSPNGARTPEQIFEELRKRQQAAPTQ
ncbi:hypothetical protein [Terriglobus roseus]|uniref:Secretin/TonB short N-terminal domain-containing protein n=1 Tax=Terriglobus roseus TaxID=392734 RepID=A0A1H4TIL1_9BACT|nr:hypothetical protein [Terriglobus roseus]SEC56227.1 hypothetical protein SAMN05443244_3766 [Terriglobus roseus]